MRKIFILLLFLGLFGCYSFKEKNKLAIPPIAEGELAILMQK